MAKAIQRAFKNSAAQAPLSRQPAVNFKNIHEKALSKSKRFVDESRRVTSSDCGNCGKKDSKNVRCGICKKAHYCSITCQRSDWSNHKPYCAAPS